MSANYGVYASLHRNCHHQIVHARFNLHITYPLPPPPHPPPYQRLIWYYKKANTSNIRKVLDLANCEKRFSHNNINAQVTVFNEIFNEIFSETTQQINISLVMTKILYG